MKKQDKKLEIIDVEEGIGYKPNTQVVNVRIPVETLALILGMAKGHGIHSLSGAVNMALAAAVKEYKEKSDER